MGSAMRDLKCNCDVHCTKYVFMHIYWHPKQKNKQRKWNSFENAVGKCIPLPSLHQWMWNIEYGRMVHEHSHRECIFVCVFRCIARLLGRFAHPLYDCLIKNIYGVFHEGWSSRKPGIDLYETTTKNYWQIIQILIRIKLGRNNSTW